MPFVFRCFTDVFSLNYIHDISTEYCERLIDRIMISVHCKQSCEQIVSSLQTLLLFLLSDPRADRPTNPFESILHSEELKQRQKPRLGGFDTASIPEEVFLELLRTPLRELESLDLSSDWHVEVMKSQNV